MAAKPRMTMTAIAHRGKPESPWPGWRLPLPDVGVALDVCKEREADKAEAEDADAAEAAEREERDAREAEEAEAADAEDMEARTELAKVVWTAVKWDWVLWEPSREVVEGMTTQ